MSLWVLELLHLYIALYCYSTWSLHIGAMEMGDLMKTTTTDDEKKSKIKRLIWVKWHIDKPGARDVIATGYRCFASKTEVPGMNRFTGYLRWR